MALEGASEGDGGEVVPLLSLPSLKIEDDDGASSRALELSST